VDRVERLCRAPGDERSLRIALVDELRRHVVFDWYAWLLTDPVTEVGSSPLADVPSLPDLPGLIRAKYLSPLNRWTTRGAVATTLRQATGGRPEQSLVWRRALAGHGVIDVASIVFRDDHGCWGWLDLWRGAERPAFDDEEVDVLSAVADAITRGLRTAQARTFEEIAPAPDRRGPVVLVLSDRLEVTAQTPETEEQLRALVPPDGDRRPVPAAAYNVAAQLLAVEAGVDDHPPWARVHLPGGTWLTVRAARVGSPASSPMSNIAVTFEPATPDERCDLFTRSHGLSPRETEVVELLARGADTRTIADELFLSPHTVQDHLKSIFDRTGARNRRTLLARVGHG
jgi:DNA-binding NarL/FixJ family response regulator